MIKTTTLFVLLSLTAVAQPNCNAYLYQGDTLQYKACKISERFGNYYQFQREGIEILDSAIQVCPRYAWAYYEKGVPYLKAGNFVKFKEYYDKAVELEPREYLGSRASCRGKFFADYQGAIDDINKLDALVDYDIGHVHDGAYHLNTYKALCYKCLGNYEKAIELFEEYLRLNPDDPGLYDYLHLGVCYMETDQLDLALGAFQKQIEANKLAEPYYYMAKCYSQLNMPEKAKNSLNTCKSLFSNGLKMIDPYSTLEDQIFKVDIDKLSTSL